MTRLYLCGAGNSEGVRLAQCINEKEQRWSELVLLDDDPAKHGTARLGVTIAGPFSLLGSVEKAGAEIVNLVARTTSGRNAARQKIERYGIPFARMISPGIETRGTEIAPDVMVYQNVTVGPEVTIGAGSVVFMGAVVGHESHVGGGCVIASNAVLNARVQLEEGVYVGSNATILPEVKVGAWATIGAGSAVIEDVPPGATAVGVPAQILLPMHGKPGHETSPLAPELEIGGQGHLGVAELERLISGIWQEMLRVTEVAPTDNFFDLGGTSLLALQMCHRIQEGANTPVSLIDLFRYPTVRALAQHLGRGSLAIGTRKGQERAGIRREVLRRMRVPSAFSQLGP